MENKASSIVVFRVPLHSNRSYSIVACIFVSAGMFLPCRCSAMGLHVTILKYVFKKCDYENVTGFIWLRVRPVSYEHGNKPLRLAGCNERCTQIFSQKIWREYNTWGT
jgi:hypothetical protein